MALPSAFLGPIGPWEFALIVTIGLLLFGKNLPEVGRKVGSSIVEFKRNLNQLKRQVTNDSGLADARNALSDLKREIDAPQRALRTMRDPSRLFDSLTHEDLATPGPSAHHEPQPSGSFLDAGEQPRDS